VAGTILAGENSSIVGLLGQKQLLEASGWCVNAGAEVQKQLLEPSRRQPSVAARDLAHERNGKAEG
jgi:hypothetical protein